MLASAVSAQRMAMLLLGAKRWRASAVDDLPVAVRLAAGGAIGLLLLAADIDLLGVLAAIGPVGGLVGMGRRDRAGMPGIGVLPGRRLARGRALERLVRRLARLLLVAL